jgi:hypothetical protein
VIKLEINKKMSKNFTDVQLRVYYKENLSKKEKSEFLRYLMMEFDYSYSSLQQKLSGGADLNKRDLILIGSVIEDERWRM